MPASSMGRVVFDDFSGGEFGITASSKAPKGSFTGIDVINYESGLIGPRAGVMNNVTSEARKFIYGGDLIVAARSQASGNVSAFCITADSSAGRFGLAGDEGIVWLLEPVVFTNVRPPAWCEFQGDIFVTQFNVGSANFDGGASYSLLASAPSGWSTASLGEFVFVGSTGTGTRNRIRFCDAGDVTTWPAGNYFDVGSSDGIITGLYAVKNSLWISTSRGEWWIFSGVPGGDNSLRRVASETKTPGIQSAAAQVGAGVVFVGNGDDYPSIFNGNEVLELRELGSENGLGTALHLYGFAGTRDCPQVIALDRGDDVLVLPSPAAESPTALLRQNGIWTRQSVPGQFAIAVPATASEDAHYLMLEAGTTSEAPRITKWRGPSLSSPPTLSAEQQDAYRTFTPTISFPEVTDKEGRLIRPNKVILDYQRSNLESGLANIINIKIKQTRQWRDVGETITPVFTSYSDTDESLSTKESRRVEIPIEAGFSGGFILTLEELRGMAIERVVVDYSIMGDV